MANTNSRRAFWATLVVLAMLFVGIMVGVSVKKLDSTQFGVQYDKLAKRLLDVHGEGLHSGPPGFRYIIFPSIFTQEELNTTCVSRDGIYIATAISFQWVARKAALMDITRKYVDFPRFQAVVRGAVKSAVNDGCALYNVSQYQEQRTDVQLAQQRITRERLDALGADLAELSLKNVEYPDEWSNAVSEKEKARQDIGLATNERQQQVQIATTNFNVSQQQAQITVANAVRQAQEILVNAQAQADVVQFQYQTLATTLVAAKKALGLTNEGLISYLSVQAVSNSQGGTVDLAAPHPAKLNYQDTGN